MKEFLRTKTKIGLWVVLSLIVGVLLVSSTLAFLNNDTNTNKAEPVNNQAAVIQLIAPEKEITDSRYYYVNKNSTGEPKVSAQAYIVGDLNTGEVILAKKPDDKFPIASMSKLMTALVAKNITSTGATTTKVTSKALNTLGKNGGLRLGETIKTTDLLYPLLLESSNDAAEVIAEHFGRSNFIKKMNEQAVNLNMASTSFDDPSGLSSNNKSSASDMFRLVGYLKGNQKDILDITTKRSFNNKRHSWSNISQFLGDDGYIGGKSGYTDAAKQTVVSIFELPLGEKGTRPIAITLLASKNRHNDVESILKYLKKYIYYGGEADANTDWVGARIAIIKPEVKEPEEPDFLNLAFAGDIMLDRGVRSSVIKNYGGDYSILFEKLSALKKADISFANLEGPASDQGADRRNLYSFRMNPSVAPALAGAGMSVLSVANNHMGDWGRAAFTDTLENLKENEILYTGGGNTKAEAETPAIVEKYGMKIGFLAFSDKGPLYMEATDEAPGILLASDPRFEEIISNAAKQVDHLIVSFHFGEEYKTKHNARQELLAHKAVDAGAKIVIGAHPHVIQDTEVYKKSYIAYSLGNFIFDQGFSVNTMQGMLLNIKLNKDGSMVVRKDIVKLNKAFKPDQVIKGKEEKIKFIEEKPAVIPNSTTPTPTITKPTTTN